MTGEHLTIGDKIIVSVEVGNYGKFVRIKKHYTSINFSARSWRFITNNAPMISSSVSTGVDYGLSISALKKLKVNVFRGLPYVTFHESWNATSEGDRYINFTREEWFQLAEQLTHIADVLAYDVAYAVKKSSESDDEPDNWHLHSGTMQKAIEKGFKYRLIPRMLDNDVILHLSAFLIRDNVLAATTKNCAGCKIDSPSQRDHMPGCLAPDWELDVQCHYEAAKAAADVKRAIEKVNAAMGWSVPYVPGAVDDKQLYKLVQDNDDAALHSQIKLCDDNKDRPSLYYKLFRKLLS